MLSATPSRQRSTLSRSRPPQSAQRRATPQATEAPELPAYEPPEAPLTAESHRQLTTLLQSRYLSQLKTHLQHAAEKLTDSAGDVNERLSDARVRYEKSRAAQRNNDEDEQGDEDESSEEYRRLAETETKVDDVTGRMEEKMRQIIDCEARLQGLTDAMSNLEREEGEAQAAALGARQTRGQRRRQRRAQGDDDEGDGEEDGDDEDYEGTPERETRERNAQNPPSRKLEDKLDGGADKWNELSLTERYAGHNSYIGFYRIVHDSKFPGDEVPPLPHSSTWFSHLEDTSARSRRGTSTAASPQNRRTRNRREPSAAESESDDIAIERERISLKCPLTLLPYRDPVTSTKCPHSFEREAIHDMISRSNFHIPPPAGRGGRRIRAVKCPVCSIPLTANDLRADLALLRRVRRAEELSARETEDDQLDGSQRRKDRVTLASDAVDADDAMDVDVDVDVDSEGGSDRTRVKSEPVHVKDEGDGSTETGTEEEEEEEEGGDEDSMEE